MHAQKSVFPGLPSAGFMREADLLGQPAVTAEEAALNRQLGRRNRRPQQGKPRILPISRPTLWRWVKTKKFPAPVSMGSTGRVKAWRVEDIADWMARQAPQGKAV